MKNISKIRRWLWIASAAGGLVQFSACHDKPVPDETLCEQHFGSGEIKHSYISTSKGEKLLVNYRVHNGQGFIEGDIGIGPVERLDAARIAVETKAPGEIGIKGIVIDSATARWPNKKVFYVIDQNLTDQARVADAIKYWEANTEMRFSLRKTEPDYVRFVAAAGCYSSSVGRAGGEQTVGLGSGCTKGNVIHEIGHVVGLWHEQGREDRGKHIEVVTANILPGKEDQFNQHIRDGEDVGSYDFDSIMHYGANAFSVDPNDRAKATIITKPPGQKIGQRQRLSTGDISTVKKIYP